MDQDCFVNRELSWLEFNHRVLDNADYYRIPLCERMNFLSIFQSNLDEFFMVRIGSLIDQKFLDDGMVDTKTGMTPSGQIEASLEKVRTLCAQRDKTYYKLLDELDRQGISLIQTEEIKQKNQQRINEVFTSDILPYLSYYSVSKKKDFPFLNNKDIYAVAILENKKKERRTAVVPCSSSALPRLIELNEGKKDYVLLEEMIFSCLQILFPKDTIISKVLLRITRNADIDADSDFDDDLNYRDHMKEIIKMRKRLSPVRMEINGDRDNALITYLRTNMKIPMQHVFVQKTPFDLSFLYRFSDMLRSRPELFYSPKLSKRIDLSSYDGSFIKRIMAGDVLLHYPYDHFNSFIQLLHECAADSKVTAIRMTLYRLANNSKVVEALAEAAENGKRVEVFVELKARFDEENNIEWSRRLEMAGCRVIYGIEHIKVHSKLCLITRIDETGKERFLTQIGTGNYNEKTSRIYTDFSILTYNQEIGQNALDVFIALSQSQTVYDSDVLLVSPHCMQSRLIELIENEIAKGPKGRIRLKLNSLTDRKLMNKLIEASCAGVRITMIVRGICCLVPGVRKKTENIRIQSVVGRYLEHSRLYIFGERDNVKVYISSADWMTRNMSRRVEIACPILDNSLSRQLQEIFEDYCSDTAQSWKLEEDGQYRRIAAVKGHSVFNAQESFYHGNQD